MTVAEELVEKVAAAGNRLVGSGVSADRDPSCANAPVEPLSLRLGPVGNVVSTEGRGAPWTGSTASGPSFDRAPVGLNQRGGQPLGTQADMVQASNLSQGPRVIGASASLSAL